MFTSVRITSVAYYEKQDEVSRKENLQYYTDNGANDDEARGVWWTPEKPSDAAFPVSKPLVARGEAVDSKSLHRLSQGRDPETGDLIIQSNSAKRSVGYDCQLSAPKSVSVLWGIARGAAMLADQRGVSMAKAIEDAHQKANARAMQYAYDQGLIVSRRGKGGKSRETAEDIASARYTHHTSRAGDPQLHTHNVLLNVCRRSDGTTGTLDNAQMLRYQGAIAAIYRAELASELKANIGVSVSKDERNFLIDGISDELVKTFSKRRNTISEAAKDMGLNGTAGNRKAAKFINFKTRQDKSEQPPLIELFGRWQMEAKAKGWDFGTILESIDDAAAKKDREAAQAWQKRRIEAEANGQTIPAERPAFDMDELKARAFAKLTEHNSTFEYRTLCKEVFEELQIHCSASEAVAILDQIEKDGQLVRIGDFEGEAIYSTPEIIERERTMLRSIEGMKGNLAAFDPALVERIIAAGRSVDGSDERKDLRQEQARAVRHILAGDQIAVMEGRAGAGKSFTLGAVTDAAHEAGFVVHGLAPSWKATGVLREDTRLADEYARAITGWINRVKKGEITLDPQTMIIVDEAGMVGLNHMADLVAAAEQSGARLILSGDSRQLQPVGAGAPMAAIARLNGSAELAEIARQKVSWQRAASVDFSTGRAAEALAEYDKFGQIRFADDGEDAMNDLLADYADDMAKRPDGTRLILASTNADATALNDAVRGYRRQQGELTGTEIVIETLSRGNNGRLTERGFCKGDRVILGETVNIQDRQYVNSLTGILIDIHRKENEEAVLTINWDDGRILTGKESEFVGYRDQKGDVPAVPKLSHAYAMTVHASQGQTVDACFIYNGRGMGLESTYVSMTRHRHDAKMYVDSSRIYNELSAKGGRSLKVSKGEGKTKENDDELGTEITREQIRERLFSECRKSEAKKNVCDFQNDVREWIWNKSGNKTERLENEEVTGREIEMNAEKKRPVVPMLPAFAPKVRGIGQIGRPELAPAAKAESERMKHRLQSDRPRPVPKPKQSLRITDDERDAMARHNMRVFLERRGLQYVESYSPNNGMEAHILRHREGGKVSVLRGNNGVWTFSTRDGDQKGMIWDYVAWQDGKTRIQAMHQLRREIGTTPGMPPPAYSPSELAPQKTFRERLDEAMGKPFLADAFREVRERWERMKDGVNSYLVGRGITADTQAQFASEIRTEGASSKQNPGGVCFAHRDLNGNLVGYERKGPKANPEDKRSFSMFAAGGDRRLGLMGDQANPERIYVSEVQIDGLSLYQADGNPQRALIASTYGTPSIPGLADLYTLAKKHPRAEIHIAMDNDTSGRAFAQRIEDTIREARGPQASVVDRRPGAAFKDWNDQIQGKRWEGRERVADEAKAKADQERREVTERMREQAMQEQNRPRGPRR